MRKNSKSSLLQPVTRLTKALGYSLRGLHAAFESEFSFRCDALLALLGLIGAALFARSALGILLLISPLVLVLAFELVNTAIENIIDELGAGEQKKAFQVAKDCGSAAVFLMLLLAVLTWICYFLPVLNRFLS